MRYPGIILFLLAFSLVSCSSNRVRVQGPIKYQVKTIVGKNLSVTIKIKNLNNFTWYVPYRNLMDHYVNYKILVDGRSVDLFGMGDMPFTEGIYNKIGVGEYLESTLGFTGPHSTLRDNIKKGSTWFVWSADMEVYQERPSIKYVEKFASRLESDVVKLGGRVLLY